MPSYFEYIPIGDRSQQIGQALTDSVRTRIRSGLDVDGNPAPKLNPAYAKAKMRRGLKPIRDWTWSGRTLAAMEPSIDQGSVGVTFTNDAAERIAAVNNARTKQFGVADSDRRVVVDAINALPRVRTA